MKNSILIGLVVLLSHFSFAQYDKVESFQLKMSAYIINQIERNNIDSVFQYFDASYLKKHKSNLKDQLSRFYEDYKTIGPDTRRIMSIEHPVGLILFGYNYIDASGTVLKIDFSFKKNDANAKVVLVEIVTKQTFKIQKQRSANRQ